MAPSKYNDNSIRRSKDRSSEVQRVQFCIDSRFHLQITWEEQQHCDCAGALARCHSCLEQTLTRKLQKCHADSVILINGSPRTVQGPIGILLINHETLHGSKCCVQTGLDNNNVVVVPREAQFSLVTLYTSRRH